MAIMSIFAFTTNVGASPTKNVNPLANREKLAAKIQEAAQLAFEKAVLRKDEARPADTPSSVVRTKSGRLAVRVTAGDLVVENRQVFAEWKKRVASQEEVEIPEKPELETYFLGFDENNNWWEGIDIYADFGPAKAVPGFVDGVRMKNDINAQVMQEVDAGSPHDFFGFAPAELHGVVATPAKIGVRILKFKVYWVPGTYFPLTAEIPMDPFGFFEHSCVSKPADPTAEATVKLYILVNVLDGTFPASPMIKMNDVPVLPVGALEFTPIPEYPKFIRFILTMSEKNYKEVEAAAYWDGSVDIVISGKEGETTIAWNDYP
ncbi:MAG: hypothetical protein M3M85_01240, partial [bacterium]|nr:hypothetical protein [bacterium]